jgi:hypothetical protein
MLESAHKDNFKMYVHKQKYCVTRRRLSVNEIVGTTIEVYVKISISYIIYSYSYIMGTLAD